MSNHPSSPCVIIACGGTGGHLFPGIAVAERVKERGGRPIILISEKEIDRLAAQSHPEFEFIPVPSRPKPKIYSPKMIGFLASLWKSWRFVRAIVARNQPRAVLGMGGFTSLMPLIAAKKARVNAFLHESNAIPGKANRFCAKHADVVFVGWKECASKFPGRPVEVVGTPLRQSMVNPPSREEAAAKFGLDPARPVLLVVGGSQGARGVNRAVVDALPNLPRHWQILHITGPSDFEEISAGYAAAKEPPDHQVIAFCHEMQYACALADVALARSGASTLNELAAFGIPSVLVPFPFAAEDHQTLNANIFVQADASRLIPQSSLTPEGLVHALDAWLSHPEELAAAAAAAKSLSVPDSADRIAARVLS